MTRSTFREFDKNWELFGTFFSYCPNFRTTNSKVWTVLSTDDILLYSNIVQTFELRTLKFGLYNHLKIDIIYCPNFRTTNFKVWTVLSTEDIVQTFELRTLKFGLYYPLMIYYY